MTLDRVTPSRLRPRWRGAGRTTAEIAHEDGTVERFTGTRAEADAWLDRRQRRLVEEHGFDAQVAIGRVLRIVGFGLLLTGAALLIWRSVAASRRGPQPGG